MADAFFDFLDLQRSALPVRAGSPQLARFSASQRTLELRNFDPSAAEWRLPDGGHRKFWSALAAHATEAVGRRSAVIAYDFAVRRDRTGVFNVPLRILPVRVDIEGFRVVAADEPRDNPYIRGTPLGDGESSTISHLPPDSGFLLLVAADRDPLEVSLDPLRHPAILRARPLRVLAGVQAWTGAPARHGAPDETQGPTPRLDDDQWAALRAVQRGDDMVCIGPPGTGKSTLITALLERADGSRVCITSTEPSALAVIRRRAATIASAAHVVIGTPDEVAAQVAPETPFDLTVVDEAARMGLGVGAAIAARSRQLVVLGDDRQLPPDGGGESLLGRALACGFPAYTLRSHYRSTTMSLIMTSNAMFYNQKLRAVPSPDFSGADGLRLIEHRGDVVARVDGRRIAHREVVAVVDAVERHIRSGRGGSLGVITLRPAQTAAIQQAIGEAIAAGRFTRADLDRGGEPCFVREATKVQGEERDFVLVSFGLVPGGSGPLRRFGVLEGGAAAQTLNVALTRARQTLEVHSSVAASDLDRAALDPAAFALLATLKFLRIITRLTNQFDPDRDLAAYARARGLEVRHLGTVQAVFGRGDGRYRLGVVVHQPIHSIARWTEIVDQLRSKGWAIVRVEPGALAALGRPDGAALQGELDAALARSGT